MSDFFNKTFQLRREKFEEFFRKKIFEEIQETFHPELAKACIYSLSAGGKRIRPILLISAYLSRSQEELNFDVFYLASALECIHTYSLIHDDLPSMDNDDYRRGVLTCHKKFSEATAILAGDALNSYSFFLLSKISKKADLNLISDLIVLLHSGGGGPGMISGQIEDLNELKQNQFSLELLEKVHRQKTGALITSSLLMGNRLLEDYKDYEKLFQEYGQKLGILFQITDDIIDFEGSFKEIGKTPQKDEAQGKLTYPRLLGMERTKKIRDELTEELQNLGSKLSKNSFFEDLPEYIAKRKA